MLVTLQKWQRILSQNTRNRLCGEEIWVSVQMPIVKIKRM